MTRSRHRLYWLAYLEDTQKYAALSDPKHRKQMVRICVPER